MAAEAPSPDMTAVAKLKPGGKRQGLLRSTIARAARCMHVVACWSYMSPDLSPGQTRPLPLNNLMVEIIRDNGRERETMRKECEIMLKRCEIMLRECQRVLRECEMTPRGCEMRRCGWSCAPEEAIAGGSWGVHDVLSKTLLSWWVCANAHTNHVQIHEFVVCKCAHRRRAHLRKPTTS